MHFDDRLVTTLAHQALDDRARAAIWTQLVDLLAQDRGGRADSLTVDAFVRLRGWRHFVPERRRLASAVSIAGRPLSPALVGFFAEDAATIAAPVLVRASLSGDEWASIISAFPPASRSLIRERRDLPAAAQIALKTFGTSDFALPDDSEQADSPRQADVSGQDTSELLLDMPVAEEVSRQALPEAVPIGELVRRIEAYRKRSPRRATQTHTIPAQASRFAFETGADGDIHWVDGGARGPLIGLSIAEPAYPHGPGVDGVAAGAFRKRAAFRDANLSIAGNALLAGDWTLQAQPFFDLHSGRFEGYRGWAQRKESRKQEGDASTNPFGADMRPDSVRQLVHELRTPLNAVRGFAEMIEGEFLGPVAPPYRERAQSIVSDSGALLAVFEELDLAARTQREDDPIPASRNADLISVLRSSALFSDRFSAERAAHLKIALPDEPVCVGIDEASSARMVDRLLACVLATAQPGETIRVTLKSGTGLARMEVDRPAILRSVPDSVLFDPGFEPNDVADNELIPLGIAFVLRLIRQLAKRAHGHFDVDAERFVLILPLLNDRSGESLETN
jgi:signal transduction histidine kinase